MLSDKFIDDKPSQNEVIQKKYPRTAILIALNQLCERFSYYGIRTILFLYLTNFLQMNSNSAIAVYHFFTVICFFMPLLGAVLSDGYIGLYRTILYLSIAYIFGEVILTISSMRFVGSSSLIGSLIAFGFIAVGSGGIKPCMTAFGGNQFESGQKEMAESFFSIFYATLTFGKLLATVLSPMLRSNVKCFGKDCYLLAFGTSNLLLVLGVILFLTGTKFYEIEKPKVGNIFVETSRCISFAFLKKCQSFGDKNSSRDHWLDYSVEKYGAKMVNDVKSLCKVFVVFLPMPIFWSLYDQQGSRWTEQAQRLNGRIGSFIIKPDQFLVFNPIIVLLLVPIFEVIYPRISFFKKLLPRMVFGFILASFAFVIAAILERKMTTTSLSLNPNNQIKFVNLSPCDLSIYYQDSLILYMPKASYMDNVEYKPSKKFIDEIFQKVNSTTLDVKASMCLNHTYISNYSVQINGSNLPKSFIFHLDETASIIDYQEYFFKQNNPTIGKAEIRIELFGNCNLENMNEMRSFLRNQFVTYNNISISNGTYTQVDNADYDLLLYDKENYRVLETRLNLEISSRYTVLIFENNIKKVDFIFLTDIYPNGIHRAWQLVQITVMAIGEIMVSITGLSFAYSQAPESMKSVLQSLWLLNVAFGNILVVIFSSSRIVHNQVYEYLIYAALLGLATICFSLISYFYEYEEDNENANSIRK